MKRFLVLAALVLGLASCQREPEGLDINVGGEVETTITVNIPESETRANNSGVGIFNNGVLEADNNLTMRYIFQVYYEGETNTESRQVRYADGTSVSFPVRLVPNRTYQFVVWADVVKGNNAGDNHYVTTDLKSITLSEPSTWVAMDETRDAFTATYEAANFNGSQAINIDLYRPFAKLRVVTTDYNELAKLNIEAKKATVRYTTPHRSAFNAYTGVAEAADKSNVTHEYTIAEYAGESDAARTIFSDYFFAEDADIVKFEMLVEEENGDDIVTRVFNTDISVKPNYLTTLRGNVLTDGQDVNVEVQPGMGGTENPDINYNVLTSGDELLNAISNGGSYMLGNDIYVSSPATSTLALTRANEGKTTINLNGFNITVKNTGNVPFITVDEGDTLVFSGDGDVSLTDDSTAAFINNKGDVVLQGGNHSGNNSVNIITGDGDIFEAGGTIEQPEEDSVKTQLEALKYILANGGEFTMTENLEATDVLEASATKPVILNGNNKTISTSANRIVRITNSNANVTINDVNFVSSAVMVYPSDVRGVAIDANLSNIALTLNKCTIDFTDETTNDWTYAVNIAGNGTGHKVTVNGGTYEGANVINAHGAKNTIVVKNATLTSLYPNGDLYYGACIWVLQNQESSVYAEGNTFNGNNALAFNLGTGTALEEKNNTDNTKYVAAKVGGAYYYNIAEAINAAEDGETVKVLHSHDCNVGATVATGKTLTLDLNGKTVEGTDTITGSFGLITNKGNLTVKNGTITLKAENNRGWNAYSSVISNTVGGNLVVENVTIEHLGGTDMAYGIDNLTNGKGTSAVANINDGAVVKSCYRAIRQFLNGIEATNELYVNPGAVVEGANKSIWMQDPSKNANTGKLVVNEGATLKGNAYLTVTEGSTEWPVEVSIATSSLAEGSEVMWNANVPAGYGVIVENNVWKVVQSGVNNYVLISNADELVALGKSGIKPNAKVFMIADIDLTDKEFGGLQFDGTNWAARRLFDGQGHTVSNWTYNGGASDMGFIRQWVGEVMNINFDNCHIKTGGRSAIAAGKIYGNITNIHINNSSIEDSYWACGAIAGLYNAGSITNCTVTNSLVKSNGGTGGIVGVINEEGGTRAVHNCTVENSTINNTGIYGASYTGGGIVGLFNAADSAVYEITDCAVKECKLEGDYIYEISPEF